MGAVWRGNELTKTLDRTLSKTEPVSRSAVYGVHMGQKLRPAAQGRHLMPDTGGRTLCLDAIKGPVKLFEAWPLSVR